MAAKLTAGIPRHVRHGLLTVVLGVVFFATLLATHRQVVTILSRQTLAGIAESMLSRAEYATDYAVIRLGHLYEEGHIGCDRQSMTSLSKAVFQAGSIKDILVAKGTVSCSVAVYNSTLLRNHNSPHGSLAARNPMIVLNAVDADGTPALAVTWNFDGETKATALVSTDNLVFDMLTQQYRSESHIALALTNGRNIASFAAPNHEAAKKTATFEAVSDRYPLVARIEVPERLLSASSMQRNPKVVGMLALAALVLAFLVARGLYPPLGAVGRIGRALRAGEIVPYFQPVYDTASGEIASFEVLARWPGRDGEPVMTPSTFVPLIEANGMAVALLQSMVEQTAKTMRTAIDTQPDLKFAFNVSPVQFCDADFKSWFQALLTRCGLDARRVIVEITEREAIADSERAKLCIRDLRKAGIEVAIDDVGTGHNGLASIQGLGAAILKIDKLFVDGMAEDKRASALVNMLVDVAREYGMRTVAEGVENEEQLATLQSLGVDEVQGFFLNRPLDAASAEAELARHKAVVLSKRVRNGKRLAADEPSVATG